jgi:PII-like signaling protein
VSQEGLTLTAYFGERDRVGGELLADELLDIHARHEIRASILLRGVQGFGAKHRLRTDRLLTLSEDLPVVAMAVDTPGRIEAVLGDMEDIEHEGLLTLERVRLGDEEPVKGEPTLTADAVEGPRDIAATQGPDEAGTEAHGEATELGAEDAAKLTCYLGRHERIDGAPAFVAVCELLRESGVAGATVLLGVDGTRRGQRQRARFFARNTGVPLMVMAVGAADAVRVARKRLAEALPDPLLTVERVRVCKRDGELLEAPHGVSAADEQGRQMLQKLTIVTSEAAKHENRSVYVELVRRLRTEGAAGATSLRGIWGFHGDHTPHGDRLLTIRRHVPVMTIAIDTPEHVASLFPIADELTRERGLITSELIPAASALHTPPAL